MNKRLITYSLLLISYSVFAQSDHNCYPTNWWVGMKNPKLQLMIHGEGIGSGVQGYTISYPGVTIEKVNKVENPNYVFLDLNISSTAKPGIVRIRVNKRGNPFEIPFEIKARRRSENGRSRIMGVTSADFIYLIMPDRFANGDGSNDRIEGMREIVNSRDSLKGRHGGDLQGIQNKLDYLGDMGVTALWLNPVIENDMVRESFHGYAFTNHYKIDPRLGGDKAYMDLIEAAHKKGMKIIQDAVYNHVGIHHFTVEDAPMKDWLNQWSKYQNTSYKDQTLMDPYASAMDKKIMSDGWFTPLMPDLNQKNPFVANFLINHALWTVEHFGIDGWRVDTYAYSDLDFLNRCYKAMLDEYPQLGIFGETWVHGVVNQAFFMKNNFQMPFKSNQPGVTDFQIHWAINDALNQKYGWMEGVSKLYSVLANDFVYADPYKNSIFLDNHDISRFYTTVGEDLKKYKMGLTWLLTLRGIPEIYYGTEILMTGSTHPSDALVRKDFDGGWPGDKSDKFTAAGRTSKENEAYEHIRRLANFRKNSSAIKTGKMMQFVPFDGIYVYFRYDKKQTVMVVANTNDNDVTLEVDRFEERTKGFTRLRNVLSGEERPLNNITVEAKSSHVFELK